jgi:hypothetical protein
MVESFGRGFGTEVRIDPAKADDPFRIFSISSAMIWFASE